jgi:parallel beta-helix repeat protein
MSTKHATFWVVLLSFFVIHGLSVLFLSGEITVAGREIYVSDSFAYPRDGTAEHPYKTISEAIALASEGDTIYVFGGIYNETLIINKSISLIGGIDDRPTVLSRGLEHKYLVDITADFVALENFVLEDPGRFIISQHGALVHVASKNVVLQKNNISRCNLWAIYLDSSSDNTISGNIINDTKGIYVLSSNNNVFSHNNISNASEGGINLYSSRRNILYQNYVTLNTYGIYAKDCSNTNITQNTFLRNAFHGVFTTANNNDVIQANFFSNNTVSGVTINSYDCIIGDNIFTYGQVGVTLQRTGCHVFGNTFQNLSGVALSAVTGSRDNLIYLNRFVKNSVNAREQGSNQWDNGIKGNYWDDYNYVDRDLDGIGDRPHSIATNGLDRYPTGMFLHPPQKPSDPSPADDEENVGLKVTLSVKVVDVDSKILSEVTFYNAINDIKIGTARNVPSGSNATCAFTLPFDTTFAWYAIANDSLQQNQSDIWFFTTKQRPPQNEKPVAEPGGPYIATLGQSVSFNGSQSYDPDGTIIFYRWNFGDGSSQILDKTPTHTYADPGVYKVTLTVVDNDGRSSMQNTTATVQSILIENTPPIAICMAPATVGVDQEVYLDASLSNDPDGIIIGYRWDFDGDGTFDTDWLATPFITYTFPSSGSHVVTLEVKDDRNTSSSFSTTIVVEEAQGGIPGFELLGALSAIAFVLLLWKRNRLQ